MKNNIQKFCKEIGITENQFYGINPTVSGSLHLHNLTSVPEGFNPTVGGSLHLHNLTSVPEGFNPTVGGSLHLHNLTSVPEGFNPVVGGSLDLCSLTSVPKGFNPTVGGSLHLHNLTSVPEGFNPVVGGSLDLCSLTSIPEGFNPTVGGSLDLYSLTSVPKGFNKRDYEGKNITKIEWQDGKYIKVDGIFCEVIKRRGNVYIVKTINNINRFYIVTDGYNYSHGKSIKEAREDLLYKVGNRDKSVYNNLTLDSILSFKESIECYRIITGACLFGVKEFVDNKSISKRKKYKISEIIKLTQGYYGNNEFSKYFK
jgi:hypothetical protein